MRMHNLRTGRTVAVIGSLAVIGGGASAVAATRNGSDGKVVTTGRTSMAPAGVGGAKPLASLSAAELAALTKARAAIAPAAVAIATPILDKAVTAATITAAQRTEFLASLSDSGGPGSGRDGTWTGATGATGWSGAAGATGTSGTTAHTGPGPAPSAAARAVFDSAQTAIQAQVSSIATPVLEAAVTAGTISSTQETTLLGLLEHGPLGRHGGPGGPHGGGPGPGAGFGKGGPSGAPPGTPAA
jgi:collagen type VII alpha